MHEIRFTDSPQRVELDPGLIREAMRIVGERWVRVGEAERLAYGRDCWQLGILWARQGKVSSHLPDLIAVPGSLEEVVALVDLARQSGTPVVPYGAGSGVCGGTLAIRGGMILDTKRLDRISSFDSQDHTMRVGAGVVGKHLEIDLNRGGFTMGHYPASLICSCLGGYLAARSAGQLSTRFGKIEDMCLSLQAVAGTGEVIESARWRPDLTQLFIGSEGTLGVITEATMRVEPLPAHRLACAFNFHDLEAAFEAIRELIQAGFRPAVVRLYDEFDTMIARTKRRHHQELQGEDAESMVERLKQYARKLAMNPLESTVRRVAHGLMQRALGSPVMLNRGVDFLPFGCLLIIGFEGQPALIRAEAEAAFASLRCSGQSLGPGPAEHWYDNRFSVSYKQSPVMDVGAFVDTMEVSTTWDNLPELYRNVREAVSPHAFVMAHFSHVYSAGSSIYFTFAGFAPEGELIRSLYERTWDVALKAVERSRANITHHHGAGILKAAFLSADHRGGESLSQILKQRLDPAGIMNPGKLWDVPQKVRI